MCMYVNVRNSEIVPFSAYCCVLILSNYFDSMEHADPRKSRKMHLRSHFTRQLKFLRYNLKRVPSPNLKLSTRYPSSVKCELSVFSIIILMNHGYTYLSLLHIYFTISFGFKSIGNFECNKIFNMLLFRESLRRLEY